MIKIHYKTVEPDPRLDGGNKFKLRKSETLFVRTISSNVLKMGNSSSGIHKLLELDMKVKFPEYLQLYLIPSEVLVKKYKATPTLYMQEVTGVPDKYTDNLKFGIVALSGSTLPKNLVAARLVVKLSPDASIWNKIKWFFSRDITYIYD